MSIESIKARLRRHDRQRMRYGYSDETAPQIWERDLRALLKVAEAARSGCCDELDADCDVRCDCAWGEVCAALTELEAQE